MPARALAAHKGDAVPVRIGPHLGTEGPAKYSSGISTSSRKRRGPKYAKRQRACRAGPTWRDPSEHTSYAPRRPRGRVRRAGETSVHQATFTNGREDPGSFTRNRSRPFLLPKRPKDRGVRTKAVSKDAQASSGMLYARIANRERLGNLSQAGCSRTIEMERGSRWW